MKKLLTFTFWVLFLAFLYWISFPLFNTATGKEVTGLLRGYTPTFAAILTIIFTSKGELKSYLRSSFTLKAPLRAYVIVILLPVLINITIVAITSLLIDESITFNTLNFFRFFGIYFIFIFLDGPLGEELGWRGFFLPELLFKYTPLVSSLIIGAVMFLWHIILFAADGPELTMSFMFKYFISILGISMIFTFIFLRFSKIPIIAVLLHTSVNYFIFLRNSLVPAMRDTTIDNVGYVAIVGILGVLLMVALKKNTLNSKPTST